MTTVHVRANQTTVDWVEGADMVVERTPFVDKLIANGGLTDLGAVAESDPLETDRNLAYVKFAESGVVDAQAKLGAAYSDANSSAEARETAEKALADAQADAVAAQEDLSDTRADAADTIAELNAELDSDPPKAPRGRRKTN
jgi:hypothetical protein